MGIRREKQGCLALFESLGFSAAYEFSEGFNRIASRPGSRRNDADGFQDIFALCRACFERLIHGIYTHQMIYDCAAICKLLCNICGRDAAITMTDDVEHLAIATMLPREGKSFFFLGGGEISNRSAFAYPQAAIIGLNRPSTIFFFIVRAANINLRFARRNLEANRLSCLS